MCGKWHLLIGLLISASACAGTELGAYRDTYYYSAFESDFAAEPLDAKLLDMSGELIASVSSAFKKAANLEGTALLRDGRVVNYAGVKDHDVRFHVTIHPYGHGVGDCALVPFHTIAVDPARIPLGSVVEVAETRGMLLPDGSRHDGLWRAEDTGGAIQGDRIDLYIGHKENARYLDLAHISHLQPLRVTLVGLPSAVNCTQGEPH